MAKTPDDDLENPFGLTNDRARTWCEVHGVPWAEFWALYKSGSLARTTKWSSSRRAFISRTVDGRDHTVRFWDHQKQRVVEVVEPAEIVYAPGWLPAEAPRARR
jgi:hypothetical protein